MYCIVNFLLDTVLKLDWDESVRCIHCVTAAPIGLIVIPTEAFLVSGIQGTGFIFLVKHC